MYPSFVDARWAVAFVSLTNHWITYATCIVLDSDGAKLEFPRAVADRLHEEFRQARRAYRPHHSGPGFHRAGGAGCRPGAVQRAFRS